MTLHDLIQKYEWLEIKPILLKEYPDQKSSIEGYKKVFSTLKELSPTQSDVQIVVKQVKDLFDGELYVDVSGEKESDSYSRALEFTPWDEWLAMEVKPSEFSDIEILAHCLWEMTFVGFSQEPIEERRDEINAEYENAISEGYRKPNIRQRVSYYDLNEEIAAVRDFKWSHKPFDIPFTESRVSFSDFGITVYWKWGYDDYLCLEGTYHHQPYTPYEKFESTLGQIIIDDLEKASKFIDAYVKNPEDTPLRHPQKRGRIDVLGEVQGTGDGVRIFTGKESYEVYKYPSEKCIEFIKLYLNENHNQESRDCDRES